MGEAGRNKMELEFEKHKVVQATIDALFQEECV